jgi:hypothetical protein
MAHKQCRNVTTHANKQEQNFFFFLIAKADATLQLPVTTSENAPTREEYKRTVSYVLLLKV